jgi:histidine ammonia-lyase
MCDPTISYGLPLALAGEPIGLNYGYNIICCSTSALASENKTLAFPSVCDTIPTKANQEDHVSMAPWAARKAKLVIKNLEKILGIELLLASRGIWITQDELGQFNLGKGTSIAYEKVNELIKFQKEDIYMGNQSKATISLIESDELLNAVEAAVGEL